jgi:hypothetical protein
MRRSQTQALAGVGVLGGALAVSLAIVRPFPRNGCEKFIEGPARGIDLATAPPTIEAVPNTPLNVIAPKGYTRPAVSDPQVMTLGEILPTVPNAKTMTLYYAGKRGTATITSRRADATLSVTVLVPCHDHGP